jgi:hypothetical protein
MNKLREPREMSDCPYSGDCLKVGTDYKECGFRAEYICTRKPEDVGYMESLVDQDTLRMQ